MKMFICCFMGASACHETTDEARGRASCATYNHVLPFLVFLAFPKSWCKYRESVDFHRCRRVVVATLHSYQWQGLWTGMHAYATKQLDSWAVSRRIDGKGAFQTNVTWDDGKICSERLSVRF